MPLTDKTDPQTAIYRKLTAWQRIAAASQLYFFAREIIKGRIRRANLNIGEVELEKKVRAYF